MRKVFLSAMVFASVMAFTSCNNEEIIVVEGGNGTEQVDDVLLSNEAIFEFSVTNTGVGSRAARPVGSSAAANNVNEVLLDVFARDNSTGDWHKAPNVTITKGYDGVTHEGMKIKWTAGPDGESTSTVDRYGKLKVKLTGIQAGVTYKFVAIGYNSANPYGATQDEYKSSIYKTEKALEGWDLEEIFAGQEEITAVAMNADGSGSAGAFDKYVSIILERQVAGTLAYFENVPSKIDEIQVTHILVKANKQSKGFYYPANYEFNGVASSMVDEQETLFTFDLEKIAKNYYTANGGAYEFEDWSNGKPANSQKAPVAVGYKVPEGLKLKKGSIFGGRFVLPYDKHYSEQTLVVQMVHISKGMTKVLKELNVTTDQVPATGTKYAYDIRRNNFYSIGKKLKTDETEPVDPTDPTDPDKPIDLTKNTDITVIINDAWDVLHDMDVER